ncbi:SDR family oxidoreductase [Laribacter hongkongensis]|uniref:UDP-glucose 4-epimerase family protein n=1 Tax=Laribacter hongkongensis TaxID=168471 RepID=UPI001EFD7BB8|nr:SDR family oxidoreductase [Laribacter hongkongensis]MCG8995474.1 SDR family oxidoreductase [Laribacter hongkongensis]MCG9010291.1 SDR family oxidoreductase [Laribacter hongkongensis]MCG9046185.1 SDR family oxidoreductase [Laribacter hongkongensis]MCG9073757.1 SDR family oxidoreductase [Laribacter hongkongensis]
MTTLVTGANGFVGSALCARLRRDGVPVRAAVRTFSSQPYGDEAFAVGCLSSGTVWTEVLSKVEQVVHLAARVHVINDKSSDQLVDFRRVNVEGTCALARQAAAAGVKRFVFLSSIKVNGEFTVPGQPFTTDDVPAPGDLYAISKHHAEQLLHQIAAETGMEVVIIRPPLVYGPGVKANFESMMRWLACGVPLPLAAVTQNRRSLVALDNLVDLIVTCLSHPAAANQTFLVSDGEDLSTAELLKRMGAAMGHPARLFYLSPELLKLGASVLNKPGIYQRLCSSLQLDISKTRLLFGWIPPVSVDEGLRRAAEFFHP